MLRSKLFAIEGKAVTELPRGREGPPPPFENIFPTLYILA